MTEDQHESTSEKIKEAMEGHTDIRERVKAVTMRAIAERNLSFSELGDLVEEIFQASINTIKTSPDLSADESIRKVYEGVTDAVYASVDATKKTTEEAGKKGKEFAEDELKRIREQLANLQEEIQKALHSVAKNSEEIFKKPLQGLVEEMTSTQSRLATIIHETLSCLKDKPVTTAGVAAETILKSVSGLLLAAADAIAPQEKKSASDDDQTDSSSEDA